MRPSHPESTATLRIADREDIAAMHRVRTAVLENRLTSSVVTEQDYIPAIEATGRGWVIVRDSAIVGFAIGNEQTGNIWAFFVDPQHERRGYGRRLHDVMVSWLFSRGLRTLWLSTMPNTRAQHFYEATGWLFKRSLPGGESRATLAVSNFPWHACAACRWTQGLSRRNCAIDTPVSSVHHSQTAEVPA